MTLVSFAMKAAAADVDADVDVDVAVFVAVAVAVVDMAFTIEKASDTFFLISCQCHHFSGGSFSRVRTHSCSHSPNHANHN